MTGTQNTSGQTVSARQHGACQGQQGEPQANTDNRRQKFHYTVRKLEIKIMQCLALRAWTNGDAKVASTLTPASPTSGTARPGTGAYLGDPVFLTWVGFFICKQIFRNKKLKKENDFVVASLNQSTGIDSTFRANMQIPKTKEAPQPMGYRSKTKLLAKRVVWSI